MARPSLVAALYMKTDFLSLSTGHPHGHNTSRVSDLDWKLTRVRTCRQHQRLHQKGRALEVLVQAVQQEGGLGDDGHLLHTA